MSEPPAGIGSGPWMDLTVADAKSVRSFYEQVVGWRSTTVEMVATTIWCMNEPISGKTVAGICHARGVNRNQPAQWLIYIVVQNLDEIVRRCCDLGREVCALYELPSGA